MTQQTKDMSPQARFIADADCSLRLFILDAAHTLLDSEIVSVDCIAGKGGYGVVRVCELVGVAAEVLHADDGGLRASSSGDEDNLVAVKCAMVSVRYLCGYQVDGWLTLAHERLGAYCCTCLYMPE